MKTDSKKNPAPLAPISTAPGNTAPHTVAKTEKGTLVKKKGAQAADPTREAKPSRKHVLERSGARYGIRVGFQKQVAPEAGETQGNGRILPAAVNRSTPNFKSGMVD